jgi:hypothetical protein
MLTQEGLKKLLHYNPETGVFTWLVNCNRNARQGDSAGFSRPNGYRIITINGGKHYAHRIAWLYVYGVWPINTIDHINRDPSDNKLSNLREATKAQNNKNSSPIKGSSSKYKGVYLPKGKSKWVVRLHHEGKTKHIGVFDCEHEAALAYNEEAKKVIGDFAYFNQVYNYFDVVVGKDE